MPVRRMIRLEASVTALSGSNPVLFLLFSGTSMRIHVSGKTDFKASKTRLPSGFRHIDT